jgi:hypothetical protein
VERELLEDQEDLEEIDLEDQVMQEVIHHLKVMQLEIVVQL